jgi:alkylation response protein AidB-like acyl-CoA dehydrogenase
MNFDYSDEQKELKSAARRFLQERCKPALVRQLLEDGTCSTVRQIWSEIAELGWLGTVIPEGDGGLGLGYVELCAIAEELGRALAPVPLASTLYFFAEGLLLAGSESQRARWLPRVAQGAVIGCWAIAEGPGRPGRITAHVEGARLTGTKIPVVDGDTADVALVLANEAGRPGLFLVELAQSAVSRVPLQSIDGSRRLARLDFEGAEAERIGAAGEGLQLVDQVLHRAAVLLAFEQLGGADRCLESACEHALQRYAFGRQIGSFQAIKHRLADIYVRNELARSNAYHAAWALETHAKELPSAAAAARISASEAFGFAAKENIQVHGGMGFTWEADAHLYFRRARHLSLVAGSPSVWCEFLVSTLTPVGEPASIALGASSDTAARVCRWPT